MKKLSPFFFPVLLLSLVSLTVIGIRLRLLQMPLDRDEGEYAYAGWRMIHGGIPFLDYYNMKMPGIYAFFAVLFLVFSPTVATVRLGLILVNLGNAALMFQLGKNTGSMRTGIYSSICYLMFSLQLEFEGLNAYAEHFSILFVLAGLVLLLNAWANNQKIHCFYSGVMLGLAFLMKQPAFAFVLLALIFIVIQSIRHKIEFRIFLRMTGLFGIGSALPLLITIALLYYFGAFSNFRLFAFDYAREYVSYNNWHYGWGNCIYVLRTSIRPNLLLWMVVAASFVFIFYPKNNYSLFKILFFIFSFIAVSAGFYFRPHYFQFLIPSIALFAATTLTSWEDLWKNRKQRYLSIAFITLASIYFFGNQRLYFFFKKYDLGLFGATVKAGEFISQHSKTDATVAIFGAEPEIWFYTKRQAASGYMYVYPLLEDHRYADTMLSQYFDETLKSKPDILVYTSVEGTWFASESKHQKIFDWYKTYCDSTFKRIALIDILNDSITNYYWTEDTTIHPVNEENYIEIAVRK